MVERIKFKLLAWLLSDICNKSTCDDCQILSCVCNVSAQARKVWGLEGVKHD